MTKVARCLFFACGKKAGIGLRRRISGQGNLYNTGDAGPYWRIKWHVRMPLQNYWKKSVVQRGLNLREQHCHSLTALPLAYSARGY